MKNFISNHAAKIGLAGSMVMASVVGFIATAGATAYDPTSALTGLASSATSTASPILIAVTLAFIPFFIVLLVIGWTKGLFRRRH